MLERLRLRRPEVDPTTLVATTWEQLTASIRGFVDVGCSKFVVVPLAEPGDAGAWVAHLGEAAGVLSPLES
jgi:hypothetical protein